MKGAKTATDMMAGRYAVKFSKKKAIGTLTTTPVMKKNTNSLLLGL